ncbi:MAG TPA: ester cyclase [Acidimicrobiales bacterium]|nr:ester cyclase [Acidimicrobiales bacterium]
MADVVPISDKLREAREAVLSGNLDALARGDIEGVVRSFVHPRMELVGAGRVLEGADALRRYLEERRRAFPDQRFEVICYHHSDRAVIGELWMSGTHSGELHGVEPTGKRFRVRMASISEFDGEDLINQRMYYDHGTVARQLA